MCPHKIDGPMRLCEYTLIGWDACKGNLLFFDFCRQLGALLNLSDVAMTV